MVDAARNAMTGNQRFDMSRFLDSDAWRIVAQVLGGHALWDDGARCRKNTPRAIIAGAGGGAADSRPPRREVDAPGDQGIVIGAPLLS
jgi:hypothetical protein